MNFADVFADLLDGCGGRLLQNLDYVGSVERTAGSELGFYPSFQAGVIRPLRDAQLPRSWNCRWSIFARLAALGYDLDSHGLVLELVPAVGIVPDHLDAV